MADLATLGVAISSKTWQPFLRVFWLNFLPFCRAIFEVPFWFEELNIIIIIIIFIMSQAFVLHGGNDLLTPAYLTIKFVLWKKQVLVHKHFI